MATDVSTILGLGARLAQASAGVTVRASQAVRKTAADIEARGKANAPVDTGNLRNSIGTTQHGDLEAEVGPTAHYGAYVEYGTYRMAPQPYLGPAVDAAADGFREACARIAGETLR